MSASIRATQAMTPARTAAIFFDSAPSTLRKADSGPGQGRRSDQVVNRLRLQEIEASGQIRPEGELAGQSRPGALTDRQPDDFLENDRAPVKMQFDDVLSGIGTGRLEKEKKALVKRPAVSGIRDRAQDGASRFAFPLRLVRTKKRPGDFEGGRAAQPDDADSARTRRSRNRDDRLGQGQVIHG